MGATIHEGRNDEIDRVAFYEQRLCWEKRKEIAIALGLEPKANETTDEKFKRRAELDDAVKKAIEGENKSLLSANWEDRSQLKNIFYGSRLTSWKFGDKKVNFPLSNRPLKEVLCTLTMTQDNEPFMGPDDVKEHYFTKEWLSHDSHIYNIRRNDPRVGYLATAGRRRQNSNTTDRAGNYFQIQDALWELRVYQGEPEPGPMDRTWIEDTSRVNMMNPSSWKDTVNNLSKELDDKLIPKWRTNRKENISVVEQHVNQLESSGSNWGIMSPQEVDFWKQSDGCVEGLELPREMTHPISGTNNIYSMRNLSKTPWDRLAASDLSSKVLNPEDNQRYEDATTSYYFHRNRVHYYRLGVQRFRAFGPELKELKELSERIIPQSMVHKMKNHHAVARHNIIPQWSNHITRNGSKFVHTPKVSFDNIGLLDDVDDYIRVNPHLTKWENM